MSWSPELVIGELRPWPESVKVVRGNCGEAMRYDRSKRSKNGVERSSDEVAETCATDDYTAKLMAEVERLQGENAKLRELVRDMWRFTGAACKKYPRLFDPTAPGGQMVRLNPIDAFEQRMTDLGIEVD